jgi:4-amino-4-deoxy-L-arabinose transferase-like glycosyltransferase
MGRLRQEIMSLQTGNPSFAQGTTQRLTWFTRAPGDLILGVAPYVCVLVGFATIVNAWGSLHHDMTETWAWGKEFQLGYAKHPPFSAWLAGLWFLVMPRSNFGFYLLSGLNVAVALAGVWMLAGIFLDRRARLAALFFLMLTPSFSLWALKFNVNAPLLSTWPWATYFFLRSLVTRRIDYSVYAGVLGGMALLTKYYSLVLFATLFIVAILHPERRRYFASPAPYLTNAVGLLVVMPHVLWTIAAGFPTIDYAVSKTQYEDANVRSIAFGSVAAALATLGAGLFAYATAFGARWPALLRRSLAANADMPNAWLGCLAYGPLLLTIASYLFVNARVTIGFLLPAFFALPVAFLALSRAEVTPTVLRRLGVWVVAVWLTLLAAAPGIAYCTLLFGNWRALEPRRQLANAATRIWHETCGRRLRFVSGEQALATAVTFYSADTPSLFVFDHPEHSPWATSPELNREGVLFLCRARDAACVNRAEAYAGTRALRFERELRVSFLGRAGQSQRFQLIVRPPE